MSSMHKGNPEGGASTALLLLTDRRWINAAGRFVRRIEESDLLSQDDLDLLARAFLAAGEQVYCEAPGHWFGGPIVQIELGVRTGNEPLEEQVDAEDDPPVVVAREVRPPLRRWAAGRLVRREPASWSALVHRAGEVDARAGAAIMLGLLDGIEALAPAARELIIGMTAAWPQSDVRKTATEVAARQEPAAAQARARAGPGPQATLF